MLPESTVNLIVTGILTLVSTLCGIYLGFWLERHYRGKETQERLFKALLEEMKLNYSLAKRLREMYMGPEWTVFELSPLYTLAYQNIHTSGELTRLSRDSLSVLEDTYEMIHVHNRQAEKIVDEFLPRDRGLEERLGRIEENLKRLVEQLPTELNFLS